MTFRVNVLSTPASAMDGEIGALQNGESGPVKTAKQLEKEAKKQAKLDKLKQKLDKKQSTAPKKEAEVSFDKLSSIC